MMHRRTGLKRAPLVRRAELERRTGLRPVSAKRRAENRERKKNAVEAFGENPRCVVPWCAALADDVHERKSRARGGSITDMANGAPLCRKCHTEITDNEPAWAFDLGLLVHSWDGDDS